MRHALHLGILGPLEARAAGSDPAGLGGQRQRALLAILTLHANQVVSTDGLIDQLWPGQPPATALHTIQVFVSRLRRALGPLADRLVTQPPGYLLVLGDDELDAVRCERLYVQGREALAGDAERALRLLCDAEALWRGPPLADFTYEPFAQSAIARLEELRMSCREQRIEAELALGRHADAVPELEEITRAHPLREHPWAQLMLALYRSARQAEALDAFQQARRMLVEDLGVEPGLELRALEMAILRHDPALLPSDRPIAPPMPEPAPGPPPALPALVRRFVTVVVCVATVRSPEPEVARRLVSMVREEAAQIVARHRGTFQPGMGNEMIAVFGLPIAREDDALRALRAADDIRRSVALRLEQEPVPIVMRLGLESGEVVVESLEGAALIGEPLERAIQLARTSRHGEVLVGHTTRAMSPHAIRAEPAHERAWRLEALVEGAPAIRRLHDKRMIGRDADLAVALAAFERVTTMRAAHQLTVLGDPGIGKSRLFEEVARRVPDGTTILLAQCQSYGDESTLRPLREAVARLAGGDSKEAIRALLGDEPDADLVAGLIASGLGLDAHAVPGERVPWALRRLLEVLGQRDPVLLCLEDAHWATPPLLDLLEYLVDWLTTTPVLLLGLARPELLEARPAWGGGRATVSSIVLAPLPDHHAAQLLDALIGDRPVSRDERAEILSAAEGNPLFAEQLLLMRLEDEDWDPERPIPASIQALLASRLDRLGPGERALIERAAVVGREFWPIAVIELLPAEARPAAGRFLDELVHRGLVRPEVSTLPGYEALRFHHILICDVAYRTCPKALRARLHEDFAGWDALRGDELDELVGYHLEQAFNYRRELERLDEELLALAERGGERLAAAGRRALARGDPRAASRLLNRALELLEAGGGVRPDVRLAYGSAVSDCGDFRAAVPVLQTALEAARASGDETLVARLLVELSNQRLFLEPNAEAEAMLRIAQDAIELFERVGDEAGLARSLSNVGWLHWTRGHCAEMEQVLERALLHAERAGNERERGQILDALLRVAVVGPRPVDAGIRRCRSVRERAGEDVVLTAVVDVMLAVFEAMQGRIDRARELYRGAHHRLDDLGLELRLAGIAVYAAMVELIAGDPGVVVPQLERALAALERAGERGRLPTAAAFLARTRFKQGRLDDALALTQLSEEIASEHDTASQILWRGTRGRVLARTGDGRAGREIAHAGVAIARRTDFVYLHADALVDYADACTVLGDTQSAAAALGEAIDLNDAKQDRASADTARALRASLEGSRAG